MARTILSGFVLLVLSVTAVPAQQPEGYFDVMTVKVKPEKRTEFDAICKKIVDANRRQGGDLWIASEIAYGEGNTVYFTTPRRSLADIDKGMEMFMGALGKAYGSAGMARLFQDFNNCILSSRSEIRRRRMDLSINMPADLAVLEKMVAESRWSRTTMLRVRPGQIAALEAQLLANKEALAKADAKNMTGISQSIAGTDGTVFYITTFRTALGGFDQEMPLTQSLGPEGYEKLRKTVAETVQSVEVIFSRFLPELSNPPQSFMTASPDFWAPKPTALAKASPESSKPEKKKK